MDIDASQEIWSFVSGYDLSGLIGCTTNSIENALGLEDKVQVYPNPANQFIQINTLNSGLIAIHDQAGKLIMQMTSQTAKKKIDISALHPGIYILRQGHKYKKFIKE